MRGFAASGFVVLAAALAAAVVHSLFKNPALLPWQIGALAVGLALGVWRLRYGVIALVFLTPLLGMIPRRLGIKDLSLPEHMLIPLLVCGACAWRGGARRGQPSAIDRPLAIFLAVVALSAGARPLRVPCPGAVARAIVAPQLGHHFSFTIWDFTKGPFLVVHYTVVASKAHCGSRC